MTFYCFPVLSKKSRVWTILARHEDTLDEHSWLGMDFIRMSQSAALEWIEMLRGSNIDRAPLNGVVLRCGKYAKAQHNTGVNITAFERKLTLFSVIRLSRFSLKMSAFCVCVGPTSSCYI